MRLLDHELVKKFSDLAVSHGLFKSGDRLEFRAKQVFGDIDLNNKALLEIGCGDGIYCIWASLHGARPVIGLEPDTDGSVTGASTVFKGFIRELSIDNITYLAQTIESFESGGQKFDIILSNRSINHLDETSCSSLKNNIDAQNEYIKKFIKIRSLMKDGGKLIILDSSNQNFFSVFKIRSPFCPNVEWKKHQPPEIWINLLRKAGFFCSEVSWPSRYSFLPHPYCLKPVSFFLDSFFRIEADGD